MTLSAVLLTSLLTLHSSPDDTPMCDVNAEQIFQPRATMPFTVTWAPLESDGTVVQGVQFKTLCGPTVDKTCSFVVPSQYGSRRYSFAIVPKNLFVPTEGKTRLTLCKAGDPIPDDQGGTCPSTGVGLPNSLTLFDKDGNLRSENEISKVLEFAEGAYVEGVIRLEAVPPAPLEVVARRPRNRAP